MDSLTPAGSLAVRNQTSSYETPHKSVLCEVPDCPADSQAHIQHTDGLAICPTHVHPPLGHRLGADQGQSRIMPLSRRCRRGPLRGGTHAATAAYSSAPLLLLLLPPCCCRCTLQTTLGLRRRGLPQVREPLQLCGKGRPAREAPGGRPNSPHTTTAVAASRGRRQHHGQRGAGRRR